MKYNTINTFSRSFSSGNIGNFKPVVIYDNADVDKIRILTENRKKVAVYRWVNKVNGNIYIGSSTNLHVRMYTYFSLRSLAKSNRPIDRALLKHGQEKKIKKFDFFIFFFLPNFRLEILEYCSYEDVLKREQYYLDLYKPHYNIATIAVRKKIKKYNFFTFFSNYFRI